MLGSLQLNFDIAKFTKLVCTAIGSDRSAVRPSRHHGENVGLQMQVWALMPFSQKEWTLLFDLPP